MRSGRLSFLFLNLGHFLDHLFMLIFATVAALRLATEWDMTYSQLIPYATAGFVAFGVCAIPAGWLADKWSREGMMVIFFLGIGASSIAAAAASSPFQIGLGLTFIGVFAAIYHPVGLALVVQGRERTGIPLALNGIFGNLGVASAALLTGYLIDSLSWRVAFIAPGLVSIGLGLLYLIHVRLQRKRSVDGPGAGAGGKAIEAVTIDRGTLIRVFAIVFFTTAMGGLIFQCTTFALPKIFDERLPELATSATLVGWYAFVVFAVAAFAQLVVGYLVDHHSVRTVFAFVAILQAAFFAVMVNLEGTLALAVSIGFMLVVFGQIPINDVLVGRIARSEWRSRAYSLRYIVTFSVMAIAIPLIAGLHATWGFGALFVVMAVAASGIFIAVLGLPSTGVAIRNPSSATA